MAKPNEKENSSGGGRRSETALRRSEELNRRIIDVVPGGIVTVAADGSIVEANAEAQRLLGLSWDDISQRFIGDVASETIWEDGSPCPVADYPVSRCLATGQPQPAATIGVRRSDGQLSWAIFTAVPVRESGVVRPAGAVVTCLDITERKRAEEILRQKGTRLRLLVEQMPAILWTTDPDLRFTSSMGAGLANLNLQPNQVVGMSLFEYFGTSDPDFLPIATTRRALAGESVTYEFTWQNRTFHVHVEPFLDSTGQCVGTIGAALDITERKRAEQKLRESEELHRAIAELTSDYGYVCQVYSDGNIVLESVTEGFSRVTGYALEEINAQGGWLRLIHPGDLAQTSASMQALLAGERGMHALRIVTKSGEVRWIRYSTLPIWDESQGRVVRLLGAVQDITEHKEDEAKLREYADQLQALSRRLLDAQENERRHIARELHDEVGQNLTALKLSLEMLARTSAPQAGTALTDARALVNKLIAQVRNLSLDLRPGLLDDLGLVPVLVWHFQRYMARTNVRVAFEHTGLDQRLPPAVETAAYRIVQEALTNVARHAGVTEATVRLWLEGGVLGVQVEDLGAGFDAENLPATRSSSGLVGMRERAHLLGGQLTVDAAPGAGTRVTAELPVSKSGPEKGSDLFILEGQASFPEPFSEPKLIDGKKSHDLDAHAGR
jgi:PAS domain S-box-containing protein